MKSIEQRALEHLPSLCEGLLDADLDAQVEDSVVAAWIQEHCKGQFKLTRKKSGAYKVKGTITIKGAQGSRLGLGSPMFEEVDGTLNIEDCPNITSLEGLFELGFEDHTNGKVKKNFTITNCPALTSLKGCPDWVDGLFSVSNCRSLKSLEFAPRFASDVVFVKCGKRFSEAYVKQYCQCAARITCSDEELDANLTEALQDPVLIKVWDRVINNKKENTSFRKWTLRDMTLGNSFAIDKLSPADRESFKWVDPKEQKECLKAVRRVEANTNRSAGFVVCTDDAGEPICIFSSDQRYYNLQTCNSSFNMSITEIIDKIKLLYPTWVHVYAMGEHNDEKRTWQLQSDRRDAKNGALAMQDPHEVLKANQKRYKEEVTRLKSMKGSDQYKTIINGCNMLMSRFQKFIQYIFNNPTKFTYSFEVNAVFDAFQKGYTPATNYNKNPRQEYGLIYCIKLLSEAYIEAAKGEARSTDKINRAIESLKAAMERCDKRLKQYNC